MINCYTYQYAKIEEGIPVVNQRKLGHIVPLGIREGNRYSTFASMTPNNPPEIEKGRIMTATTAIYDHEDEHSGKTKQRYVLSKPNRDTRDLFILRINTLTDRGKLRIMQLQTDFQIKGLKIEKKPGWSCGAWKRLSGTPHLWRGTSGLRGFLEKYSFTDDLICLRNGDAVLIMPEGCGKLDYQVCYFKNNKCHLIPSCDYDNSIFEDYYQNEDAMGAFSISDPEEFEEESSELECTDEEWEAAVTAVTAQKEQYVNKNDSEIGGDSESEKSVAAQPRHGEGIFNQESPA